MQRTGYERFALFSNPFHDLASESLAETEVFHVTQESDEAFERMKQEVLDGSRKAFVLIAGPLGAGKTQRLRVTRSQAEEVGAFSFYLNMGEAPPDPLAAIAQGVMEGVAARKVARGFVSPRWARVVKAVAKGKRVSPETAGRRLAEALGKLAPAYLLLNDLDALQGPDRAQVLGTLLALVSNMPAGVMVTLACQDTHAAAFQAEHPALASRLNRIVALRGLTDEEAELVVAKRMSGKRLIEDLDPLYPFTPPAVAELNRAAGGSPRRLLQLADLILDGAVKERAFQVGPELTQQILARLPPVGLTLPGTRPVPAQAHARPTPARAVPVPARPVPVTPTRVQAVAAQPVAVQATPVPVQPVPLQPDPVAVQPAQARRDLTSDPAPASTDQASTPPPASREEAPAPGPSEAGPSAAAPEATT